MTPLYKDIAGRQIEKGDWVLIPARHQYGGVNLRYGKITNFSTSSWRKNALVHIKCPSGSEDSRVYKKYDTTDVILFPKHNIPEKVVKLLTGKRG